MRVIEGGKQAASRPRTRVRSGAVGMSLTVTAMVAVSIFGLVLLNIYVAQSSFRLNELQKQVTAEQNRYRQMRYEISTAQSPARLAEISKELGLVTPDRQESLPAPPPPEDTPAAASEEQAAGADLKALLAGRR